MNNQMTSDENLLRCRSPNDFVADYYEMGLEHSEKVPSSPIFSRFSRFGGRWIVPEPHIKKFAVGYAPRSETGREARLKTAIDCNRLQTEPLQPVS